jgi:hypothetical protein
MTTAHADAMSFSDETPQSLRRHNDGVQTTFCTLDRLINPNSRYLVRL